MLLLLLYAQHYQSQVSKSKSWLPILWDFKKEYMLGSLIFFFSSACWKYFEALTPLLQSQKVGVEKKKFSQRIFSATIKTFQKKKNWFQIRSITVDLKKYML